MQELIIQMALCLIAALAIGFLFGWLVKRAFVKDAYEPKIEALTTDLKLKENLLKEKEEESEQIKEQFLSIRDTLEEKSYKITELEEQLGGYQAQLATVENTLKAKELHLDEKSQECEQLQSSLKTLKEQQERHHSDVASQQEELRRVKEHHSLLNEELLKLKKTLDSKNQELTRVAQLAQTQKEHTQQLEKEKLHLQEEHTKLLEQLQALQEHTSKIAQKSTDEDHLIQEENIALKHKIEELQSIINEKNMASIELKNKADEIDKLNQKIHALQENLTTAEVESKKIQEQQTTFTNYKTLEEKEGFDLMSFAKRLVTKVPRTREEIEEKAQEAIKRYKDKNA